MRQTTTCRTFSTYCSASKPSESRSVLLFLALTALAVRRVPFLLGMPLDRLMGMPPADVWDTCDAIVWSNVDEEGAPNPRSLHEGRPPARGEKVAVNCWIADREFAREGLAGAYRTTAQ